MVFHACSAWNYLEANRCSTAALCLRWCMQFWKSRQVFEATTARGLRPLLAILTAVRDLKVGVALVIENFSKRGVGFLHLDFLGYCGMSFTSKTSTNFSMVVIFLLVDHSCTNYYALPSTICCWLNPTKRFRFLLACIATTLWSNVRSWPSLT